MILFSRVTFLMFSMIVSFLTVNTSPQKTPVANFPLFSEQGIWENVRPTCVKGRSRAKAPNIGNSPVRQHPSWRPFLPQPSPPQIMSEPIWLLRGDHEGHDAYCSQQERGYQCSYLILHIYIYQGIFFPRIFPYHMQVFSH